MNSTATQQDRFDAVVVGGGPAGATFAALAARQGAGVCVLERERFPRFHVGESLLPGNNALFERLELLDELMNSSRAVKKFAATFTLADDSQAETYRFANALGARHPNAFHVERAQFDARLLRRAAEWGAEVREGWSAEQPLTGPDGAVRGAVARDPGGATHELLAPLVVDASGRDTFLATRLGSRAVSPEFPTAALFGHFEGADSCPGLAAGDLQIVVLEDGWAWLIPLPAGRVSAGIVLHQDRLKSRDGTTGELWETVVSEAPALRRLLGGGRLVGELHAVPSLAYTTRDWSGDGWVAIGDATMFLDPVFSTGVLLAMQAGEQVADLAVPALRRGDEVPRATFLPYERTLRARLDELHPFIAGFYDPAFIDQFLRPNDLFGVRRAITALLAGEFDARLSRRLRRAVFWLGVWSTRRNRRQAGLPVAHGLKR